MTRELRGRHGPIHHIAMPKRYVAQVQCSGGNCIQPIHAFICIVATYDIKCTGRQQVGHALHSLQSIELEPLLGEDSDGDALKLPTVEHAPWEGERARFGV